MLKAKPVNTRTQVISRIINEKDSAVQDVCMSVCSNIKSIDMDSWFNEQEPVGQRRGRRGGGGRRRRVRRSGRGVRRGGVGRGGGRGFGRYALGLGALSLLYPRYGYPYGYGYGNPYGYGYGNPYGYGNSYGYGNHNHHIYG